MQSVSKYFFSLLHHKLEHRSLLRQKINKKTSWAPSSTFEPRKLHALNFSIHTLSIWRNLIRFNAHTSQLAGAYREPEAFRKSITNRPRCITHTNTLSHPWLPERSDMHCMCECASSTSSRASSSAYCENKNKNVCGEVKRLLRIYYL